MKIFRAIMLGVLLWILIFFEASILVFGFKLDEGVSFIMVHFAILIFLIVAITWIYFRGNDKPSLKDGIFFGLILAGIDIILDVAITVPLFVSFDYTYLLEFDVLIGYLEMVVIPGIVGGVKKIIIASS